MNHFSKNGRNPILIVDKEGILGDKLSQELGKLFVVVCVGQNKQGTDRSENIIFSEYGKSVPIIPNGNYSHMLVVDNGIRTTGFLSEFIKKARRDKSEIIFIVNLFNFASFYKHYKKAPSDERVKIVIFGDIFDKDIYHPFIKSAIRHERIQVEGDGLSKVYLVFLVDVVSGIIEAAFKSNSSASIFYLFPKYPPTQISLARMIQKANPDISIDFTQSPKKEQAVYFPPNGKYLLLDNYPLERKIKEFGMEELAQIDSRRDTAKMIPKVKSIKSLSLALLLSFFFLVSLPIVSTMIFSFLGFAFLGNVKTEIENGDISNAQKSSNTSRLFFNLARESSELLLTEAKLIGQENILVPIIKKISLGHDLSLIATYTLDASKILSQVFTGKSESPKKDFAKGTNLLKNATVLFRQNEAEAKSDLAEERIPKDLLVKIENMSSVIKIVENAIGVLPGIFGFDGKKTYLILFQNNMELRPGGGFIGSYGLLTLDAGKIADFSIADVYDADGQLKGHVEPPYPIRRHLKIPHWYLRDSNFDVDFAKGASSSAILLNAELGQMVDGVIGIDLSFVKNILEAIGEVYVADYRQKVTSDNLFEITQSHAEKDFFPGSRQKKNFLRSLFNSIQLDIALRENLPYLQLANTISDSISEKHLLFAFNDEKLQDLFAVNDWSSTLWGASSGAPLWEVPDGTPSASINDFLGINEANLGVNKANYFVKRKLSHKVNIDREGSILETIRIEYDNSSNSWPGGDYTNYLRVILPLDAVLLSISFDGASQEIVPAVTDAGIYEAKNFVKPLGLEVERYEQSGKTIYGFLVNIEASKSKIIEIKYTLLKKNSLDISTFSYNLSVFKQPGTENYPYSFSLSYPKHLRVADGLVSFSGNLEGDRDISVSFAKR